jgi:hypothetical protein
MVEGRLMLSKKSIELLIDLVEIKLGSIEVFDRDDRRALRELEACLKELAAIGRRPAELEAKAGALIA